MYTGQPAYEMLDTHPDWEPSLLLGHNKVKVSNQNRFARHLRRHVRSRVQTGEKLDDRVKSEAVERRHKKIQEVELKE